ncbi:MAG: hypothetical protein AABX07_03585 [Nanoarchaeota archaeon]
MGIIKIEGFTCERCAHIWASRNQKNDAQPRLESRGLKSARFLDARESPRSEERGFQDSRQRQMPIVCPKCKSPYWNIKRKNKPEKGARG